MSGEVVGAIKVDRKPRARRSMKDLIAAAAWKRDRARRMFEKFSREHDALVEKAKAMRVELEEIR